MLELADYGFLIQNHIQQFTSSSDIQKAGCCVPRSNFLKFCLQAMDHSGMFPQTVLVLERAFAELADSCRDAAVLSSNVTSQVAHR